MEGARACDLLGASSAHLTPPQEDSPRPLPFYGRWTVQGSCPREFDAAQGRYRTSTSGYFAIRAQLGGTQGSAGEAQGGHAILEIDQPGMGTYLQHVVTDYGTSMHLSEGSEIRILQFPPGSSPVRPAHLTVRLVMRKRGRHLTEVHPVDARPGEGAPAPCGSDAETGSDTEWSEGFESDAGEEVRPAKAVRRLRRRLAASIGLRAEPKDGEHSRAAATGAEEGAGADPQNLSAPLVSADGPLRGPSGVLPEVTAREQIAREEGGQLRSAFPPYETRRMP